VFAPEIGQHPKVDQSIVLSERAASHVVRVLRMRSGDMIVVFAGHALEEWQAQIVEATNRRVVVALLERAQPPRESALDTNLVAALTKGDRFDFALQKSVELGVRSVTPIITERCVVRLEEKRIDKRLAHWHGVVVHACEQSGRLLVPSIERPVGLGDWLGTRDARRLGVIFDPAASQALHGIVAATEAVDLLVGPEGGLTNSEVELATQAGLRAASLGPRVLRAETAAAFAVGLAQQTWGDLS
jgi:16S rRNA (uracil1498-N3)-methyltransferase